ncbi:DUF5655 domain-containing protein [Aquimonas voraii]|uniref:DUF5655 domain-containing protein n=1 Tax=Aquimonas voraii TaxID=265719 RepID=A0A1G6RXM1_9GAMM|nr:DUF5655 domain-containing protein [Aquimonas voraii]SDD09430.1 protein of unknown function [Aquimonas voraii]
MADPAAALITQLKNIQSRSGHSLEQLYAALQECGLSKHGEKRSWLMERFGLGYGDANTVVSLQGKPLPVLDGPAPKSVARVEGDPLDALYAGNKAGLRPLHEALMTRLGALGEFEIAPKKSYLSLRRKKQFAMVGPATAKQIEIGLNCRALPEDARLKVLPPGGMCQATTRIAEASEIDEALLGWIRLAYASAG